MIIRAVINNSIINH